MKEPKEEAVNETEKPDAVTGEDILSRALEGIETGHREMEAMPKKFAPGEGFNTVYKDIDDDDEKPAAP